MVIELKPWYICWILNSKMLWAAVRTRSGEMRMPVPSTDGSEEMFRKSLEGVGGDLDRELVLEGDFFLVSYDGIFLTHCWVKYNLS